MEISLARCKSILDTLPIGLYTGRRIAIDMDENAKTSYYTPMEDKIIVSYPIIAERCSKTKTANDEEAVRSMLYHEVSHAILTPLCLHPDYAVNVFEDERIETVLKDYYMDVDFRKQLYDVFDGSAPEAKTADGAFFNAVRFGLGGANIQKAINEVMKCYCSLHRNSERWHEVYDYNEAIHRLYDKIRKEFRANPEAFQPQAKGQKGEGEGNDESKQLDNLRQSEDGEPQDGETNENQTSKTAENQECPDREVEMSMDELKRAVGAGLCNQPDLNKAQITQLNDFQKTVETIIGNFNKRNSGGSGINSYSGVFNPRAVARKDYRYFERSMSTQGNNKFGTCHLNLFIDCSGSFERNVPITNGILRVLTEIERKNRNFSLDVVFINHDLRVCKSVAERTFQAWGSNAIPDNIKEIILKLQKPQTCNYNIVLFDGDAICEDYNPKTNCQRFGAFDMKQTTLITDPDNKKYMKPEFTASKVIITKNYTDELIKHITNALMVAFS
jgi:hypothetical protein